MEDPNNVRDSTRISNTDGAQVDEMSFQNYEDSLEEQEQAKKLKKEKKKKRKEKKRKAMAELAGEQEKDELEQIGRRSKLVGSKRRAAVLDDEDTPSKKAKI